MHSIKKILPRAAAVLCFVFLLESAVQFLYQPYDKYSIYANREYREQKGGVDTLFCGTSHVYYAFDPALFDKRLGTNSFNMGTGAQPMSSTYFLIREALDINPVKTVYLGISFSSLLKEENDSGKLGAYDRLITLRGRLRCIVDETSNNRRVNELFYSTRVNKYLDLNTVKTNLKEKLDPAYETTPPESDGNRYMYKGYLASDRIFSGKRTTEENKEYNVWDPENISQENLDYLVKIINLCEKKGVDLNLIIPPVTDSFLERAGDSQGMHDYYANIARAYEVDLYDFTNYQDRPVDFPNEYFKDASHLNQTGSQVFGNLLIDMILEKETQPQEM
ncbi:MAG: D-alanyl-lipoteichoic acid biosynthesis protein DltD [Lachnospiraceae bacterium]|jgi:hypothetical protein|nr:D-alanyl-lipoteichoic acid biosynthesis protein DltD [Lachnospiraceae bacterium]